MTQNEINKFISNNQEELTSIKCNIAELNDKWTIRLKELDVEIAIARANIKALEVQNGIL